ncbi:response regulator [Nocardioides pantholopis]|uniref:response regulator n=1 Tax=Nocardioides pantholopis TaxID=2483798 RepID=UPI000F0999F4|nr:response regulator transcription factor [Nocardioides pantholopis]
MRRPADPSRVAIIDDHDLFAESLDLALAMQGYEVHRLPVPESPGRAQDLLDAVHSTAPGIVLLDLDLGPFGSGIDLVAPLVQREAAVLVVTAETDRATWGACLARGAARVLAKSSPLREISVAVRRLAQGLPVLAPEERQQLIEEWQRRERELHQLLARFRALTAREQEVLTQLALGRTVREIAHLSVVSEATVRTQVRSILAKLGVSSQLAAVGLAHQLGWSRDR